MRRDMKYDIFSIFVLCFHNPDRDNDLNVSVVDVVVGNDLCVRSTKTLLSLLPFGV
jgi:hypothetical protein